MKLSKGDPATFEREWRFHMVLTGLQNQGDKSTYAFFAFSRGKTGGRSGSTRTIYFNSEYTFTKAYRVKAMDKLQLKKAEVLFSERGKYSYLAMQNEEIRVDCWEVIDGSSVQPAIR